ncbi:hypothetical protein, partial [Vibrio parahaemolyticus]
MSLTLIFIALVTNLMCFFYDYKNKNTFLFIWMLNVVFVLYPISVSYFSEYQIEIDSSLMFISICNFTYLVSSIVIRSMLRRESGFKVDFSQSVNFTYKWLVWILALSIPLIFIFKGISLSTIMQS